MAMDGECICKFLFFVSFDTFVFYVMHKRGFIFHTDHLEIRHGNSIFPARLMNSAEKEISKSITAAVSSSGVIQNAINYQTGKTVTLGDVRYLAELTLNIKSNEGLKNVNSTKKLIHHFKEKNYDYVSLFDRV